MIKLIQLSLFVTIFLVAHISVNAQYNYNQQKETLFLSINNLLEKTDTVDFNEMRNCANIDTIPLFYSDLYNEYQLRKNNLDKNQTIVFNISLGLLEQKLNKVDKYIASYNNALKIADNKSNKLWILFLTYEKAKGYRVKGNYERTNELFYKVIKHPLFDLTNYSRNRILTAIIQNYESMHEYNKALEILLSITENNIKNNDLSDAAYNLVQMGRIASITETDTFYFEYYHRAVDMAFRSTDKDRIANNFVNIARAYRFENYPEKSLFYLLKAKKYNKYSGQYSQGYFFINLSITYLNLDSINKSIKNAKKCLAIANNISADGLVAQSYNVISQCFDKKGQQDSALFYLQKSLFYQTLSGQKYNHYNYKQLSELSFKKGNYKLALSYLDTSFAEYKKNVKKNNAEKLIRLREKSDYYIHRARISDLVISNQKEREKSRLFFTVAISVVLLLGSTVVFIVFYQRRHKQLKNAYINLVSKNIELDKINKKLNVCELSSKPKKDKIKDEERIIKNLKKIMHENEEFTNNNLSLSVLAKQLQTNTSYLSTIINSHYNCNLRTLINRYRIGKAKELLTNKMYSNYSVEGIAHEIGFNSRSSFYQAFKKETGLNPIIYLKNYKLIEKENKLLK